MASPPGRLCAAEIDVLLNHCWMAPSPGLAMEWVLEELLGRGHFVRVAHRGHAIGGEGVTLRVTSTPIPRSARPALGSFADLFNGRERDVTAQGLADFVAENFGDQLEVKWGVPRGSPRQWYEWYVVGPLGADGLVSVGGVEETWAGSTLFTTVFLVPTPDGERLAAYYRNLLPGRRRDWRHGWRASATVTQSADDVAVTTLQRIDRTRSRERVFISNDFPNGGGGE